MNASLTEIESFVARGQAAQRAVETILRHRGPPQEGAQTPNVRAGSVRASAASPSDAAQASEAQLSRGVNPTPLLNRKAVRNFLLERAAQLRPFNRFERVSQDTLNRIDAELRAKLTGLVQRLPSKGKTI